MEKEYVKPELEYTKFVVFEEITTVDGNMSTGENDEGWE